MDVTNPENGARTAWEEGFPICYTAHFGGLVLRGAATDRAGKRRGGWPINNCSEFIFVTYTTARVTVAARQSNARERPCKRGRS